MIHLINEEQAKHFDTLMKQLPFAFDMGKNCLTDLQAAQLLFANLADDVSGINLDPVQEFYGIIPPVDGFHHKADLVLIQIPGVVVQVEADTDGFGHFTDTCRTLEIKLDSSGRCCLGQIDAL